MARARNIKPGLVANAELAECSIWARYLFALLPTVADREGRLEDRPKQIKGELLRFDSQDAEPLLIELASHRFIIRYQNSDGRWIQITKFWKHQTPHYSEKASHIKPPTLQEWPRNERPHSTGKEADDEPINTGDHQENTETDGIIKGGSQPPDSLIPDSLNLIPDSLIPEKTHVGLTPGGVPSAKKKNTELRQQAAEIISFLNGKAGRNFDLNGANADYIVARLKDGESVEDCRAVIALKCRQWLGDEKMSKFLRPETLFNRTKFATYKGELGPKNV